MTGCRQLRPASALFRAAALALTASTGLQGAAMAAEMAKPDDAAAEGPACPGPAPQALVSAQIRLPSVSHDLTLSGPDIARRAAEVEPRIDHDHEWVDGTVGLTTVTFLSQFDTQLRFRKVEKGVCVEFRRVSAVFGFTNMTVYVASEYGTASCAYKEVLNHEHKHVEIFRNEVLKARRPFADAIEYTIRSKTPFLAPDRETAETMAQDMLKAGVQPVLANMWLQGDAKHELLDSQESYRRTERHCADW
ncbi:hypothetical protein ACFOGJ_20135 [Marinibaculum pumilum]|uniref:DUF922 domain-containing protein n=1 Tax=Marinibaculum pumilum TaxID=1766165 RepID=A0ABV7L4L0_9PROT